MRLGEDNQHRGGWGGGDQGNRRQIARNQHIVFSLFLPRLLTQRSSRNNTAVAAGKQAEQSRQPREICHVNAHCCNKIGL